MKTARQEIADQRMCFGEKIGRFEVTDFDISPSDASGGPYIGLSCKHERLVLRKSTKSLAWYAMRYTRHEMGWLSDEQPMLYAETLAGLLVKIEEVMK